MNQKHKIYSFLKQKYFTAFPWEHWMTKHDVCFIHIPKNAGTSIRTYFGAPRFGRQHLPFSFYKKSDKFLWNKATSFAVLREPHERFISLYNYLKNGGNKLKDASNTIYKSLDFSSPDAFLASVIESSQLSCLDPLFFQQAYFVLDKQGNIGVDYLVTLDQLPRFLKHHWGRPFDLKLNASPSLTAELKDSNKDRLRSMLSLDFELFDKVSKQDLPMGAIRHCRSS